MKNLAHTGRRVWNRSFAAAFVAALVAAGCAQEAPDEAPDAGVALEGTGAGSAEEVVEPLMRVPAPGESFLVEFEGFASPESGILDVRVLEPEEWLYLDPTGPDGMAMRRLALNDYCRSPVNTGSGSYVGLNTIAGSVHTGDDCPRTPTGSGLFSYFVFDGAFCAQVRMTSHHSITLNSVYAEILTMSGASNKMYANVYKTNFGLGNGAPVPSPSGNNGPTDVWGLVSYGNLAPGASRDEWWIFRRPSDGDFYFRGVVPYSMTEVVNGLDDDCDGRIDEDTLSYPNGTGCESDLDCAGGQCDCFPDICDETHFPQCRSGACGDGITQANEDCDTSGVETADCDGNCTTVICGDNTLNEAAGEICDPGVVGGFSLTCNVNCTPSSCGDGITNPVAGEECDDGNSDDFDGCTNGCLLAICGDALTRVDLTNPAAAGYEECDLGDGLNTETSACPACRDAVCGDGWIREDITDSLDPNFESCDGDGLGVGGETATCNVDCSPSSCGDGVPNSTAGEVCDTGGNSQTCDSDCTAPSCGDTFVNDGYTPPGGPGVEQCDSGASNSNTGACTAHCRVAICGDGLIRTDIGSPSTPGYEACDNGAANSDTASDACRTNCRPAACGDGVTDVGRGEECDDGGSNSNTASDACRTNCTAPYCGDGVTDFGAGETCDAAGAMSNTGACRPGCHAAVCGDGVVRTDIASSLDPAFEVCDNGAANSDTVPGACRTDCRPAGCGDGVVDVDLGEQCDDGDSNSDTTPNACRTNCTLPTCGDSIVDTAYSETCDEGSSNSNTGSCLLSCQAASCGDGFARVDLTLGETGYEACDNGAANSDTTPNACRTTCVAAGCGDDVIDSGEVCDEGDENSATEPGACRLDCTLFRCGDFVTDPGEECDLGDGFNSNSLADTCRTNCTNPRCGDGVADTGEQCDDANVLNTDACLNNCQTAYCGDSFVRTGVEGCDDGNGVGSDGCSALCGVEAGWTCTTPGAPCAPICGDGLIRGGETCDDHNTNPNDGCSSTCTVETGWTCNGAQPTLCNSICGDGLVRGSEACDDGNTSNTDGCLNTCVAASCGDGFTWSGHEQCDDANTSNNDACTNSCNNAACGDGFVRTGVEQCDDGNTSNNDACLNSCNNAFCGDGFTRTGVEQCDDANTSNTDACLNTCTTATCGDGFIRAGVEACDDGNTSNTDACLNTCAAAICGDGFTRAGVEQCDDGNTSNTDACLNSCNNATCGDGFTRAGVEQCDDGNTSNTDACLNSCNNATCGDGFIRAGVEQCDDANTSNADACLNSCTSATCGDGFVRAGVEQCDDGNTSNTDTCTNVCNNAVCGDGFVRAGVEACDDGNTSNTDACLNSCAAATCGDGFVRAGVEQCDDANSITTDACISCVNAFCGDGFTRSGVEECDTGPTLNPPATPGTYRCESCTGDADGDGYLPSENDCAPTNFAINPGASDTVYFDAVDSNCDNFSGDASDGNIRVVQAATCAGGPFPTARCFSSANYSNPLQSAINASSAGQIVLVRGTVAITPTQLKDGVDVYGGWLSAWTAWSSSTANYSTVSYTTTSGNQIQAALWGYGLNSASVTDVNYLRINTVRGTTDTTDNVATSFYGVNVGDSTNFRLVNNIVTVGDAYAGAAANNGLWARESTSPVGGTGDSPWVDPGPRWSTVYAMGGQGNGWYAYCPILNGGSGVHPFQVIRGFSGQNGGHAGGSSIGVLLSNASASQVQNNTITAGSGGAGGDGIGGGGPSAGGQGGHSVSVWIIGSTAPSGWPAISGALGTPEDCPTATAGTYGGNTLSYGSAGNGGYAAENDWDEGRPGFQARCHRQTSVFEWSYDCNPQATTNLLGTSLEGWANGGGYNFPGPQACSPAMSPVPAY